MDQLPELHMDELSLLELFEQNSVDTEFYTSNANGSVSDNLVGRDANLGSMSWLNTQSIGGFNHNKPTKDQDEIFSDTESLTSSGSAVPSPAMFDNTEQQFSFLQDDELKELSVKGLNLKLKGLPKDVVNIVKKRRRTLKNRGYAHSCRTKRIEEKSNLQRSKAALESMIADLQQQVTAVTNERDQYRNRYEDLVRRLMIMRVQQASTVRQSNSLTMK